MTIETDDYAGQRARGALSQVRGRIKKWETCKAKSWEAERTPMEFSAEITGDEGDRQAQSIGRSITKRGIGASRQSDVSKMRVNERILSFFFLCLRWRACSCGGYFQPRDSAPSSLAAHSIGKCVI